jgi:hypothetical protein
VEHSADPDDEKALQDGCRDALALAAEDLGRRQLDEDRQNLAAWDAWVAVHRDALADEFRELQLPDAVAGKLVVQEQACPEPDGWTSVEWAVPAEVPLLWEAVQLLSAALDKRGAGRSAAQSCAVPAVAVGLTALVLRAAELAPECMAPDSVRQAAQNWLLEPKEYGLLEEQQELKVEER